MTTNNIDIASLILNKGRFAVACVVGDAEPVFEEYQTEWEMLSRAKTLACTVLFNGDARKDVRLVCAAGDKTWTWTPEDNNLLKGVGDTRPWEMFKVA